MKVSLPLASSISDMLNMTLYNWNFQNLQTPPWGGEVEHETKMFERHENNHNMTSIFVLSMKKGCMDSLLISES